MQAILLAAGLGRRLEGAGGGVPKCLLRFDGASLLQRALANLRRHGVHDTTLVTGYKADRVEAEIDRLGLAGRVRLLHNRRYRQGSLLSLWCARRRLRAGPILLMDADVLHDGRMLARLLHSGHENCLLLDRRGADDAEAVTLCIRDDRPVEFSKQPDAGLRCDRRGESVGFFRFDAACAEQLAVIVERMQRQGHDEAPYEEAVRALLLAHPQAFGWEEVDDLPWIEIDFPADVQRAKEQILPQLRAEA